MQIDGDLNVLGGLKVGTPGQIGGGAYTLDQYEPFPIVSIPSDVLALNILSTGSLLLWPFELPAPVNVGYVGVIMTVNIIVQTNTRSFTDMHRWMAGLYARETGSNFGTLTLLTWNSLSIIEQARGDSWSITYPATTTPDGFGYTVLTSATSDIVSAFEGARIVNFPMNTVLTAGDYWFGFIATRSSSSSNVGFRASFVGPGLLNLSRPSGIGSGSAGVDTGAPGVDPLQQFRVGWGVYTAGTMGNTTLPNRITLSSFTMAGGALLMNPTLVLWSTR